MGEAPLKGGVELVYEVQRRIELVRGQSFRWNAVHSTENKDKAWGYLRALRESRPDERFRLVKVTIEVMDV